MLSYGFSEFHDISGVAQTLAVLALTGLVAYAAVWDAAAFEIPDWLSAGIVAAFAVWAVAAGLSWSDVGLHLAVAAAIFAGGVVLFALGAFGGGDVKMLAAVALWAGTAWIGPLLLAVSLFGGVLCIFLLAARALPERLRTARPGLQRLLVGETRVPYGIAIALGTLSLFFLPARLAGL